MADLKTNYQDDVLDTSVNDKRKYNMIQNADGTVSFEDVTTYLQAGDNFGAADVNAMNTEVNALNSNLKASNEQQFQFAYQDGKYGYMAEVEGADTFFPFKSGSNLTIVNSKTYRDIPPSDSKYNHNKMSPSLSFIAENDGLICIGASYGANNYNVVNYYTKINEETVEPLFILKNIEFNTNADQGATVILLLLFKKGDVVSIGITNSKRNEYGNYGTDTAFYWYGYYD